ncbi:hypothetical protein METBIDRAFT_30456 [Metschnikowia bicuspidata var. bicuspidata NRRL YB-4993]|uniref:Uncharacterized protein n=1 Tax=Metschnikowia bicuspidata var. bicuspidata NRRL YB-4993 TaxID=869754 RepID=A0A1A0HJX4_9ASCO|nr:hypothetical protein METBIDRAFT_30456 [Metschnikowia bicuspidata var. bicuspidata NRRL YB-4993]OBA24113.1 hypothetical protein METBIDRAFT_30456 [Metschnikowia bicuspidata var. bicuspidata NRRL YB-4993]
MALLVGPYQRGFIQDRRSNQNPTESPIMVELMTKSRGLRNSSQYQAVLMADFTEASDRNSHQYMEAVLKKMGIGTAMNYAKAAAIVSNYEKVSNSFLSACKPELLGFAPHFPHPSQDTLPFPQAYIHVDNTVYLGKPLKAVDWMNSIKNLPFQAFQLGYSLLALIKRAQGTVQFIFSKPVYPDIVKCMTSKELQAWYQMRVCRHQKRKTIYTRPNYGGYGLIKIKIQLQGHRIQGTAF